MKTKESEKMTILLTLALGNNCAKRCLVPVLEEGSVVVATLWRLMRMVLNRNWVWITIDRFRKRFLVMALMTRMTRMLDTMRKKTMKRKTRSLRTNRLAINPGIPFQPLILVIGYGLIVIVIVTVTVDLDLVVVDRVVARVHYYYLVSC